MANPLLFRSLLRDAPLANASNQQGAAAFAFTPRHKLAQMVMTGCMNETFYASGQAQLNDVLATAKDLDDLFLAQLAIYGRERGMMKDMPALLTAILAARGSALLPVVFTRVINNGRMLRNFVQMLRSGVTGRRSLGTRPKKLVQRWLQNASEERLLQASVGNAPSLADIVKMVHPRPQAVEYALENIPPFRGNVVVCPDVSGSMKSSITGYRKGATSKIRCVDVAGLIAAAVLRNHPQARVLPFECDVVDVRLDARQSVMHNAQKLAAVGGGTNCSAPLRRLLNERARVDLVIMVSDNESWVDKSRHGSAATMECWIELKKRNPQARLVCIDLLPYGTTQAAERSDILNVGGFSDEVFTVIDNFVNGRYGSAHWLEEIEAVTL